jgi:glycosyltransferase involved in cell wall biosynthesis
VARDARAVSAVAFDARETSHMSDGVLAYSRQLRAWLPRVAPDLRVMPLGGGDNFDLAEQVALPLALARSGARLAHFPTIYVPRFVPIPYVLTIHDAIDLHFPRYVKRSVVPYWRAVVAPVARGARAVIVDDEATIADLERFLHVDPRRARVVPLGSDDASAGVVPMSHPRPYLLYVTNRRPHKNIATLVRAWESLPAERAIDLVLSGDDDGSVRGTRERGAIVHLGRRAGDELARWYAGAAVYVHPALREGFGLPMLEAMRAGVPVVAARSALPRVLAPYALGVDPRDALQFRAALLELLDDPPAAAERAAAARAATAALTWERTAAATAAVYREFL